MIRISPPENGWEVEISNFRPTWLARALGLTASNRDAKTHVGHGNIWSEIKPIYVALQKKKCAYCERILGSNGIEWDVEHFRPKQCVDAWSSKSGTVKLKDRASSSGYYLMAYNPRNYLASCKVCNSIHKRNFFPVRKRRRVNSDDESTLAGEDAYLINPLDPNDDSPEELIEFLGPIPRPRGTDARSIERAVVTIELLDLGRSDLIKDRCSRIIDLWLALKLAMQGDIQGQNHVALFCAASSPHASCCRSFVSLYQADISTATLLYQDAYDLVVSHS
jgi:hypothetical protein